jgi:hypothetical protein
VAAAIVIFGLIFGPFLVGTFGFWYLTREALASVAFGLVCFVLALFALKMIN